MFAFRALKFYKLDVEKVLVRGCKVKVRSEEELAVVLRGAQF